MARPTTPAPITAWVKSARARGVWEKRRWGWPFVEGGWRRLRRDIRAGVGEAIWRVIRGWNERGMDNIMFAGIEGSVTVVGCLSAAPGERGNSVGSWGLWSRELQLRRQFQRWYLVSRPFIGGLDLLFTCSMQGCRLYRKFTWPFTLVQKYFLDSL